MKKLFSILLLTCAILAQAQYNPYQKKEWKYKEAAITLATNLAAITLDAMGDAYNDMGKKELGHALNAASVGTLLVRPFLSDMNGNAGWYISSYILLRMGCFDILYNQVRGLPIGYSGTSSFWDNTWNKHPDSWKLAYQSLYFTVGFVIPIKEL